MSGAGLRALGRFWSWCLMMTFVVIALGVIVTGPWLLLVMFSDLGFDDPVPLWVVAYTAVAIVVMMSIGLFKIGERDDRRRGR